MKRMIKASISTDVFFSEDYKDEIYLTLGRSNPDWDKFFVEHLQPYCDEVLEELDAWEDVSFIPHRSIVTFYDASTDDPILGLSFRKYSDKVTDMWLDEKTQGPESLKHQIKSYLSSLIEEKEETI